MPDPERSEITCNTILSENQINVIGAAFIPDDNFCGSRLFDSYGLTNFINIGFPPELQIVQKNPAVAPNPMPFLFLKLLKTLIIREVPKYKQCARRRFSSSTSRPYKIATFPKVVVHDNSQSVEPINFGDDGKPPKKPNQVEKKEPDAKHDEDENVYIGIIMDRVKQILEGYIPAVDYLREYLKTISLSQHAIEILKRSPDFTTVNNEYDFL